ncbi:phosphatidylinositol-specific phospholipase C1-like protein [Telmatobacter bradus]|uniref:phosphatidylinositol-specific phospholipase C1-like protein n=1 Tax=Telmatobacter bradus TaxID=474953 RepID=UPI003B431FE8
MRFFSIFWADLALSCLAVAAVAQTSALNEPHLNQIQIIGTHNSYHAGIAPNEASLWKTKNAEAFKGLEYSHPSLTAQLDSGIRQIELDIFADSQGGLFANPAGPRMVAAAGLPADANFDPEGLMKKPGFKVLHMQDLDYRSTCQPFVACLAEVRTWVKAHPAADPVFILVETKQSKPIPGIQQVVPEAFTPAVFDALDAEIRSVFSTQELITPDQVRGPYKTLNQAVLAGNWPTLKSARSKVIFLMDQRPMGPVYLAGHPSLQGRVLFTNATPGEPDAAFIERNDGPTEEIAQLVRQGYLVRTRTDSDTREARANQTSRRDVMILSGAQMLSTDYPASEPAPWEGHYKVELPGAAAMRCNPVNAPAGCTLTPSGPSTH